MTGNLQEVLDLRRWREANFDSADQAVLNFAEVFTLESHRTQTGDIQVLRRAGFSDHDIIAMTLCAGYRHYITRIADATGIEVDSELEISPVLVEAYSHSRRESRITGRAVAAGVLESKHGPWVKTNEKPEEDLILAPIWAYWRSEFGTVSGLLNALSLLPEPVEKLDVFWRMACFGSATLGGELDALIGITVGGLIPSPWLSSFYDGVLGRVRDGRFAHRGSLEVYRSRTEEIILAFVRKITEQANTIVRQDIEKLREAGLSDSVVLDVIVATALLNGMGRMANVLGVLNHEPLKG